VIGTKPRGVLVPDLSPAAIGTKPRHFPEERDGFCSDRGELKAASSVNELGGIHGLTVEGIVTAGVDPVGTTSA
jgi:hypothetical protein